MIDLLITQASELIPCRRDGEGPVGGSFNVIENGAVAVDDGAILDVGSTEALTERYEARRTINAEGKVVSPGLVDSHSHLVYAGSRHEGYRYRVTDRPENRPLEGGIQYTVSRTRKASYDQLHDQATRDLDIMLRHGTTLAEAKSGYGLNRETELRLLRVADELDHDVDVVGTYLGAHVVPEEYEADRAAYVDRVIEWLPEAREYAEYCDVCCDPIGFTAEESERIAREARNAGFKLKVHADQTGPYEGAELAADLEATSADHLDYASREGIRRMADAGVTGVLLPGVTFHMLEMIPGWENGSQTEAEKPFMPRQVRDMVESGMRLALSADYNPGSCPTPSLQLVMQIAARMYRLDYEQIWQMSTIEGAHALDRSEEYGSLEEGKRADIVVWDVPEHGMVIHRFGVNLVDTVVKDGGVVVENRSAGGTSAS